MPTIEASWSVDPGSILVVDPGKMTGYAWTISDTTPVHVNELPHDEFVDWLFNNATAFSTLVCESFKVTARTVKQVQGDQELWSVEQIGIMKALRRRAESAPVIFQAPSDAKSFATDAKLKRAGWYVPLEHGRDAMRHLMLYTTRTGSLDPRILMDAP